jgi:hypothetical protein
MKAEVAGRLILDLIRHRGITAKEVVQITAVIQNAFLRANPDALQVDFVNGLDYGLDQHWWEEKGKILRLRPAGRAEIES